MKEHFPKELWSTIDPNYVSSGEDEDDEDEGDPSLTIDEEWAKYKKDHAKLYEELLNDLEPNLSGDDEAGASEETKPAAATTTGRGPEDEDPLEADQVDDEYADADEEGDDYNAEQYFDDGDGDGAGDDGGGGDEAGVEWYE